MSLQQYQLALINLVRLPDANRGENFDGFLNKFELSTSEKKSLHELVESKYVKKFGTEQRSKRFGFSIKKNMRWTNKIVKECVVDEIIYHLFEPEHKYISEVEHYPKFVEFLEENREAFSEKYFPDFIFDLIKYEQVEFSLMAEDQFKKKVDTSDKPLINPNCHYRVVSFKHDILSMVDHLKEDETNESLLGPHMDKPTTILFLKTLENIKEEQCLNQQFEIDEKVANFIESCESNSVQELPDFFDDLVSIGLCVKPTD